MSSQPEDEAPPAGLRGLHEHGRPDGASSYGRDEAVALACGHTAAVRARIARHRDQLAAARDIASEARDAFAAALDTEMERLELEGTQPGDLAARSRAQAATQRKAGAEDGAHAASDREHAALDRLANAREIANAETDEVTGALRRRVGLAALQRELKRVNDEQGHAAGDRLLRMVVWCVTDEFRSYDLILRFGGDEFVCSITGDGLANIDTRFGRISDRLGDAFPGASISTGIGERRGEDTVSALIDRADGAMIDGRPRRRRRVR